MRRLKLWLRFVSLYLEYTGRDPWDVDGNNALHARVLAARDALGQRSASTSLEEPQNG